MLGQILVAILTVAVVVMVGVDLVRTGNEDLSGQHDGWGDEIQPRTVGGTRGDRTGVSVPEPFGTGVPAGGRNAGLGQHPGRMDPAAVDLQPARTGSLMGQGSSTERDGVSPAHGSRHVRSRLQLMVLIPAAAVTVIALCVVGLAYFLSGARINAPDGAVRMGAVLWAVVIIVVMITVLVLAVLATISTGRSVLQPLYRLRSRAIALADGRPSDAAPADVASPDEIGDIARAI
ncbi:MAG TPA: hypothetical protein VK594_21765, partial [Streptosporangiaceae bacterium]|nr:hypothetical protein [Streptosporangiaceae bacterium]